MKHFNLNVIKVFCRHRIIGAISLALLSLLVPPHTARAQCGGEVQWQWVGTNAMRCGRPGYVTNDTYYRAEEIISTVSSSLCDQVNSETIFLGKWLTHWFVVSVCGWW